MLPKHKNPETCCATAPYNFIPLPENVVTVPSIPDHDVFSNNSGFIECSLKTLSPLYTRCGMSPDFFKENSDPGLLNFLNFLLDKKRIDMLPAIADEYFELVDKKLQRLEIGITTTVAIDKEMKEKIKLAFENRYGKKVLIKENIDPKILGGMVLEIGNQVIDGSVKAQLSSLKDHLLATTV